jgi:hypothetical protein
MAAYKPHAAERDYYDKNLIKNIEFKKPID